MTRKIRENIYEVGAGHPERKLFDALIPLPNGTTYNAYILQGKNKTVLFDTVDPAKTEILFKNLADLNIKKIDYVVAHHAEQDHSGSLPEVIKRFPEAIILASPKCQEFLVELLLLPKEKIKTVADNEKIDIGGKTLHFMYMPWVHWPETIVTYVPEEKILFSCDFFGSHYASAGLFVQDEKIIYSAAKRYYAEIMMPFRSNIKKHLETLKNYEVEMICPSHGPVYNQPAFIVNAYREWSGDTVKNEVVLPYVSMHDSTRIIVEYFAGKLKEKQITVKIHDLSKSDIGELAMDLVDAATLVLGTPAVLAGAHPVAAYAAYLVNALRPKLKYLSIIGSFGWGAKTVEQIAGMLPLIKAEILEPVMLKGYPKPADLQKLDILSNNIAEKHKTLNK